MRFLYVLLAFFSTALISTTNAHNSVALIQKDTLQDLLDFADKLNSDYINGDGSFFYKNFNTEKLREFDTNEDPSLGRSVREGLKAIGKRIHNDIESGSYYDFINYYEDNDDGSLHLIFRIFSEETGINYHDYSLRYQNNKLQIEDIYIYLTGESYLTTLIQIHQATNSKATNSKKPKTDALKINSFFKLYQNGNYKYAYLMLNSVKDREKLSRGLLILKAQVALKYSEDSYIETMEYLLKKYPNDPSIALMSVDYYYTKKDFNAVFKALDILEETTGDDFLNYNRGNFAFELEEYDLALEYFQKVVKEYATFITGKLALLITYDKLEQYEVCIPLLDDLINTNGITKNDLDAYVSTELISLSKSAPYKKWKS